MGADDEDEADNLDLALDFFEALDEDFEDLEDLDVGEIKKLYKEIGVLKKEKKNQKKDVSKSG